MDSSTNAAADPADGALNAAFSTATAAEDITVTARILQTDTRVKVTCTLYKADPKETKAENRNQTSPYESPPENPIQTTKDVQIDTADPLEIKRLVKRALKTALYSLLKRYHGHGLPWGSLTGIRPTRMLRERLSLGESPETARDALTRLYDVQPGKTALLRDIVLAQDPYIETPPDEYDVYIGIPFCVTRCSYCSFVSVDVERAGRWMPGYVDALEREMALVAQDLEETFADRPKRPRALYIGGGTPTALPEPLLDRVLQAAAWCFPGCREFTVEAGRPDTIDEGKLRRIYDAGARRVSINPQSMNPETLLRIGRNHTPGDIQRAYAQARAMGFCINMDVIMGLPGEGPDAFAHSLSRIEEMGPDNLTVHALALKRTSRLRAEHGGQDGFTQADGCRCAEIAAESAARMGLRPYYLYRQKYMAGNLENVGYARPGSECIYNIDIMEETAPVLAFGAGGISKWLFQRQRRIERAPNLKDIQGYIARAEEMAARKHALYARA